MIASGNCPECGRAIGSNHNVSPLKHMVGCLHVPFSPLEHLRGQYGEQARHGNPRAARIVALLDAEEAPGQGGG